MNEATKSRLLPLGSVLTILLLAGALFVVTVLNRAETDDKLPPLTAMWAAILTTASVFLVERRLQNYLFGVAAAALLIVYPVFRQQLAQTGGKSALEEGLVLATLVCTMFAWDLTYLPRFSWWSWLVAVVSIGGCVGLAWLAEPAVGLRAALLAVVGLAVVMVLSLGYPAAREIATHPSEPPTPWNRIACLVTLLVAPAAGVFLVHFSQHDVPLSALDDVQTWRDLWLTAAPSAIEDPYRQFQRSQLDQWCLPHVYVVLPAMAWALWRTLRRGLRQWRFGKAPLAWLLTLYTVHTVASVSLLPARNEAAPRLALTALMILLLTFWAGDLLHGMFERMMLRPPEERAAAAAGSGKAVG